MTHYLNRRQVLLSGLASFSLPFMAVADETQDIEADASPSRLHTVRMLNRIPEGGGRPMVFDPIITVIQPGDTVRFVPTDRNHNSASIKGMIPEGAEGWSGKINREIEVTLTRPGFYGYQCVPHVAMGMMGLIIVEGDGMGDNLEAAQSVRHRGTAKRVWNEIWAEVAAMGLPH